MSGHLRPCRSTAGRGRTRRLIASSPRRPGTRRRSFALSARGGHGTVGRVVAGPAARCRLGGATLGPRPQVPERRPRMALAMGLPGHPNLRRSGDRPAPTAPPPRVRPSAGGPRRGPACRHPQARQLPHLPPLLRPPPAGSPPRHPHRARAPRAPGRSHHADLHPRPQSRTVGRREPGGSVAGPLMTPVRHAHGPRISRPSFIVYPRPRVSCIRGLCIPAGLTGRRPQHPVLAST